jgi:hypothetical protein
MFFCIYHQHPEIKHLFYKLHANSFDFHRELIQEAIENNEIKENIDIGTLARFIHTIFKRCLYLRVFHSDLSIIELVNANLKVIDEVTKKIIVNVC